MDSKTGLIEIARCASRRATRESREKETAQMIVSGRGYPPLTLSHRRIIMVSVKTTSTHRHARRHKSFTAPEYVLVWGNVHARVDSINAGVRFVCGKRHAQDWEFLRRHRSSR